MFRPLYALPFFLLQAACASAPLYSSSSPPGSAYVQDFDHAPHKVQPGQVRINPSVCQKSDLRQDFRHLDYDELDNFLKHQGFETQVTVVRPDLVSLELLNAGTSEPIRFRVAILADSETAGRDLHRALLQHGTGAWGIHRSNLAILAPADSYDNIVSFAARTRLACFGVLTIAAQDDAFVIPGGYSEL